MSALLVSSTQSSCNLCPRFPAKVKKTNISLQMSVQKSVCLSVSVPLLLNIQDFPDAQSQHLNNHLLGEFMVSDLFPVAGCCQTGGSCPHSSMWSSLGVCGGKCASEQKLLQMAIILLCDSCIPTGCTHGDEDAKWDFKVICSSGDDLCFCWFL